ncbi:MAG TPA: hypothetical protein VIF62_04190 [Labilithrix sp.]
MKRAILFVGTGLLVLANACGGGNKDSNTAGNAPKGEKHKCGEAEKVQNYDLHDEDGQDHFVPCAATGNEDYSGNIHIDTTGEGILVTITATDDDFNEGKLGSDIKGRDAVIVYPKGPGTKGVEVPLKKTPTGYTGQKLIPFDDLDKLTDEGTKLTIHIYDSDDANKGGAHEELKVQVAISAGKSCEKAQDENPQEIKMGGKQTKDLTADQLGQPMKTSSFMSGCGLADSANAEICAAVKNGKPLGVSVKVNPSNNKVAACIDRSVRKLSFPKSEKLDVVKQTF